MSDAAAATPKPPALVAPLRNVAFALLWGGLATSAVGDQVFGVVLSWIAVGTLGTAAGYLVSLQALATLVAALFVGRWADRRDDRAVMAGADLARAAVLGVTIAVWLARGQPAAWTLFACVLVLAVGQALFRPALQSAMPALLDETRLLPAANALVDTTERIARLLGPGVLAMASALLPLVHFVTFDAATFLISAAAIGTIIRLRPAAPRPAPRHETVLQSLVRGFATVRRNEILWFMLKTTGGINGAWYAAFFVGLPLIIERSGVAGPGGSGLAAFGLVISAYGSTNLATTLVVGSRGIARRPARLIFGGNLILAVGMTAMGLAAVALPAAWMLPAFALAAAFSATGGPMQDITVATLRQTKLPHEDLAAAVRAFMVVNNLGMLIALLLAPTVFDRLGIAGGVVLCGLVVLAIGVAGWLRFAEPAV